MKQIFIFSTLILSFILQANAQDVKYIPNPNLDKYVGMWTSKADNKVLTIVLSKTQIISHNVKIDIIQGYHLLKIEGKIFEEPTEPTLKQGTSFSEDGVNHTDQLNLSFFDPTKKKGGKITLFSNPHNPNQLQWSLTNTEGLRVHKKGESAFDRTFTLPTNLIFTRVQ